MNKNKAMLQAIAALVADETPSTGGVLKECTTLGDKATFLISICGLTNPFVLRDEGYTVLTQNGQFISGTTRSNASSAKVYVKDPSKFYLIVDNKSMCLVASMLLEETYQEKRKLFDQLFKERQND